MGACDECAHFCLLLHGEKKDPSSMVTSFFKIMIGERYSEVMFLPPKFARNVPELVGRKTKLEDASGEKWSVTLSKVDGSLAFQEGWHTFSSEHGLKVGDLLVFYYVMKSHFVVQIYGRSGCHDLRHFGLKCNQKRKQKNDGKFESQDRNGLPSTDGTGQSSNASLRSGSDYESHKQEPLAASTTLDSDKDSERPHTVSKTPYQEGPFCRIDRDTGLEQGDDRSSLSGLSTFESRKNVPDADLRNEDIVGDERSPQHGSAMLKSPTEAGMVGNKVPGNLYGHVFETCVHKPAEKEKKGAEIPKEARCQNPEERSKNYPSKEAKSIKEDARTFSFSGEENDAFGEVVKTEPVDLCDIPPFEVLNSSFSVVIGSEGYLELPTSFPSAFKKRSASVKRLVWLVGPVTGPHAWPVWYHQNYGFMVLHRGWEQFAKKNRFQPGDECVFQLDNSSECIYTTRIVRK